MEDDFRSYLEKVAAENAEFNNVFPPEETKKRVAQEIQDRSGVRSSNMGSVLGTSGTTYRFFIPAAREHFVDATIVAVDLVTDALRKDGAKDFEIAFANKRGASVPADWGNLFGDLILVAVRHSGESKR